VAVEGDPTLPCTLVLRAQHALHYPGGFSGGMIAGVGQEGDEQHHVAVRVEAPFFGSY